MDPFLLIFWGLCITCSHSLLQSHVQRTNLQLQIFCLTWTSKASLMSRSNIGAAFVLTFLILTIGIMQAYRNVSNRTPRPMRMPFCVSAVCHFLLKLLWIITLGCIDVKMHGRLHNLVLLKPQEGFEEDDGGILAWVPRLLLRLHRPLKHCLLLI